MASLARTRPSAFLLTLTLGAATACGGDAGTTGRDDGTCEAGEPACAAQSSDADQDAVVDADDRCAGHDDRADADGDGTPDGCDLCAAADDRIDTDGDGKPDPCDLDPSAPDWMYTATVGGLSLWHEATDEEIGAALDQLAGQGVTVVEADSNLSAYLGDEEFAAEMAMIGRAAAAAHARGLRLVWYYPTLESVTAGGRISDSSMYKDHPDWMQHSIDGTPNVFYGDKAFWVEPDDESAWLDPLSGYRDYFLARVEKLAATGVDGIWFDVPLYNDIVGRWTSHSAASQARFLADTGHPLPAVADADDPVWWQWIQWRHGIIAEFLDDIYFTARAVAPDIQVIVENVTMDYNAALIEGLDGAYSPHRPGFSFVWEIDVTSESDSMIFASTDDWVSLIAMLKFGRGVDRRAPSWTFVYGNQIDDAEMVMAEAIATQNNPYELKAPEMTSTVDPAYRQRIFSWITEHRDLLYRSGSAARLAVLHSSASRDLVDGSCIIARSCGMGMYADAERPAGLRDEATWWAGSLADSLHATSYLADYKGLVKALVHLHQPFDIVTARRSTLAELARYRAVLVPDLQAVSAAEVEVLTAYASQGGRLLFTGPAPGSRNELGAVRDQSALAGLLDLSAPAGACRDRAIGAGQVRYCNQRLGKEYFDDASAAARSAIQQFVAGAGTPAVETDAPDNIHFELYRKDDRLILHAVNFTGVDGAVHVAPKSFRVSVDVSELPAAASALAISARQGQTPLTATRSGQRLAFDLGVDVHQAVVIGP
jgi:hypothetical protein